MFKLFWIRFKSDIWNFIEYLQVIFFYYSNKQFRKIDFYLIRSYLTQNPFRMSKDFLIEKGEKQVDTYGETPLTTIDVIADECRLHRDDVVYELGCGRGRTCFWLHLFIGCKVYGIEYVPAFIRIAQSVKRRFRVENVKLVHADMMNVDLTDATVVYFYGTTIEDEELKKLCNKLAKCDSHVKIITISFPLSVYHAGFKTIKRFKVKFPWGETDAYLQKTRTH